MIRSENVRLSGWGEPNKERTLLMAIRDGAMVRVRPKARTMAVVMAGLRPILAGSGTGSEVMTRIAASNGP